MWIKLTIEIPKEDIYNTWAKVDILDTSSSSETMGRTSGLQISMESSRYVFFLYRMLPKWRMADSREKILQGGGEEKKRTTSLVKIYVNTFWSFWAGVWDVSDSLFSCGWQEPHHLHGQLQTLKVVLQILSFHCEAVLLVSRSNESPAIKRFTAVRGFPKGAVTRRTSISLHIAAFQLKHAQHVRCIHVSSRASHTNTQSVSIQMFLQMFRDLYLLSTPQTWKCFHPLWLPEY